MTQVSKANEMPKPKGSLSPELKKIMDEECKVVRGRFKNYESPGSPLPLTCGKYPGQPLFNKVLQDGEIYNVPLWVARHLNGEDKVAKELDGKIGSCSYPIHGFKWDDGKSAPTSQTGGDGVPVPVVGVAKRNQRFGFESLEFAVGQ